MITGHSRSVALLSAVPLSLVFLAWVADPSQGDEVCPIVPFESAREAELISKLQAAPDARAARGFNLELWALWTDAPDAHAQDLLDQAMARIRMGDLETAIQGLDVLVAYCPTFAEGYNQRAFAHYLKQDFGTAIMDLDAALELSPRHIGALSGKALTLIGLGRDGEALSALRKALALNPWLSERALLDDLERRTGSADL